MYGSLLQFYVMNAESGVFAFSSSLSVIFFLFLIVTSLIYFKIIQRLDVFHENYEKYNGILWKIQKDPKDKYLGFIMVIRRFFRSFCLVVFYYFPILQLCSVWVGNILFLYIILTRKPFVPFSDNFIIYFNESILAALHCAFFILIFISD